jgi:hypothetical protein
MKKLLLATVAAAAVGSLLGPATGFATEIVIPDSALIPSTNYFTNDLGSNIVLLAAAMPQMLVTRRGETTMGLCSYPFHSA